MWSYYGSKSRVVHLYPKPIYDKIIEPFAGSARYSLLHFDRQVTLCDKYKVITDIWQWLQQCSEQDILGLPLLRKGEDLRTINLSEPERNFLGMLAGIASTQPRNKISAFSAEQNGRKNYLKRIASQLHKIRHWEIINGSYEDLKNETATWFIDPPYQFGGHAYVHSNKLIDFSKLSDWNKQREGQVIVCENMKADWMQFKPLSKMRGANGLHTTEAIWSNLPTNYHFIQIDLFG